VDNGQKMQEKQISKSSKSTMAAVCYGPNFLLKYLIENRRLLKNYAKNAYSLA